MKKRSKYKIIIISFFVIMILLVAFFEFKFNNIRLHNNASNLLEYLYTLESNNNYSFIDGRLYKNDRLINNKMFFDGNGTINIDKYGNVRFNIKSDDKCVYKTYLGDIKVSKNCYDFKSINVSLVKNNSKISFILNQNSLEYKISYKDDFKGKWINKKYNDNLVIDSYNSGENYIWFKDVDGNISEPLKFNVDCLYSRNTDYNSNVFYCSGSTVVIDDIKWIVLEDKNDSIKLMKNLPVEEKLSHCFSEKSEYCYYTKESKMPQKWSNSYINYYLNNVFINKLSDKTRSNIITNYICDEYDNLTCDNEMCGGYTKEEILYNNWKCTNYTPSKVKIISYDEYNKVYLILKDKSIINGNYWAINSYRNDKGSSVQYNYEFYVLENYTEKLDVKPVIVLKK